MSRGGFRAAGFMDGFMNGFDFVDRLQRADEERNERRERTAVEDARWQQLYGLRLQREERLARGDDDPAMLEQPQGEYGLLEGRTARSPQTGERLIHRSGRWEVFHD
ncbi:hypothetical protein [Solimonas sp. SE-A11]|uniref:hypothetical protein n=1 Tax=Solimonas sp. SE-A11 TaxID=3054954 RepID=UPI00259CE851|nr:hypothetical protein [Solimonas sp. SE-A11]MDM4773052.1 hypothetical protein [Solimonas sp. SE-A11]